MGIVVTQCYPWQALLNASTSHGPLAFWGSRYLSLAWRWKCFLPTHQPWYLGMTVDVLSHAKPVWVCSFDLVPRFPKISKKGILLSWDYGFCTPVTYWLRRRLERIFGWQLLFLLWVVQHLMKGLSHSSMVAAKTTLPCHYHLLYGNSESSYLWYKSGPFAFCTSAAEAQVLVCRFTADLIQENHGAMRGSSSAKALQDRCFTNQNV